jgi:sulfoquinovose isomerase
MSTDPDSPADSGLLSDAKHLRWLARHSEDLVAFYQPAVVDPTGGYHWLDGTGRPVAGQPKHLWLTARMVHCFALAELLGCADTGEIVDHGLAFLAGPLRDRRNGGWFWSTGPGDAVDDGKHLYAHAFVGLAASSAIQAGHPGGRVLAEQVLDVLEHRFRTDTSGLCAEQFSADWAWCEPYRGANGHMHLVEALMAAAEATGEARLHEWAAGIAERIIGDFAAGNEWRIPEHYDEQWHVLRDYNKDHPENQFRPYGSTVGHWLEWARLLVQLQAFEPRQRGWMTDAACALFARAVGEGWVGDDGGFVLTVDWDGKALDQDRYHWVATEAIGAAAYLYRLTRKPSYAGWYRRCWQYARDHFIDRPRGGWIHQLDPNGRVVSTVWQGKPDLYHALQATLFARTPFDVGIAAALSRSNARS